MRFSPISSRASRAREGWFAQVDDDEDVGKIVTDEIPTGLYKMGMEAILKDSRDVRIEKKKIRRIRSGCRMASLVDRQNKQELLLNG
ncbi:conserved hypothetical protein, partial [Ricinus communis]